MTQDPAPVRVYRATRADEAKARAIVDAYCEEINVVMRDTPEQFAKYFDEGSGIWLAERTTPSTVNGDANGDARSADVDAEGGDTASVVGCIILRPLPMPGAAEVKRLYVTPSHRGPQGGRLADRLLAELHVFAAELGYEYTYLDTKDDLLAAIKFYRRQGYEECPRYNENPQATMFMRRRVE